MSPLYLMLVCMGRGGGVRDYRIPDNSVGLSLSKRSY